MSALALAVVVGLAVGIVVGALGAGGGILTLPLLVFVLGYDAHDATAMSLVIVGVTAATSIFHYLRAGQVRWREGLLFAALSTAGSLAGTALQFRASESVIMTLLATVLLATAVGMVRKTRRLRREEASPYPRRGSMPSDDEPTPVRWGPLIAAAVLTGALTGFFGMGGGFLVVPLLLWSLRLTIREASGTSLLVMLLLTLMGLAGRAVAELSIDWAVTVAFAAASAAGGVMGGPLAARARPSTLSAAFAFLLVVVAAGTITGVALT